MAHKGNFKYFYLKLLLKMYFKFNPNTVFPYITVLKGGFQIGVHRFLKSFIQSMKASLNIPVSRTKSTSIWNHTSHGSDIPKTPLC